MNSNNGIVPTIDLATTNNGFGNGFFNGEGIWALIIIALLFGNGFNGGFFGRGFNMSNNSGVLDSYVLNSDMSMLSRQISDGFNTTERRTDSIINGICDLGYTSLSLNNQTNQAISQGVYNLNNAITTNGYETRIGINGVNNALASCCCEIKEGINGINYNNAMNMNILQSSMCSNTRDIIENQNENYRKLYDEIISSKLEAKNERIQEQQNEINALRLSASQSAQNEYLLNQLRNGCPVNAQIVNPSTPVPIQYIGAGCGCNCGTY